MQLTLFNDTLDAVIHNMGSCDPDWAASVRSNPSRRQVLGYIPLSTIECFVFRR